MSSLSLVCILTAGRGIRMGAKHSNINKALLPLGGKAAISHIIDAFPLQTTFVIALGHLGEQVRQYLEMAHPDHSFIFVNVDRYDGPGSGPGYSLWCCREFLNQPFYFVASDTIFKADYSLAPQGKNWAGVAKVAEEETPNYCTFKIENNLVTEIVDKELCDDSYRAFTGFLYVYDYKTYWEGMASEKIVAGERQISNGLRSLLDGPGIAVIEGEWTDVGSEERYQAAADEYHDFDFGKTDEYLYFVGDHVIKFFADASIVRNRVAKALLNTDVFPHIERSDGQFYSYRLIDGETLYAYNNPLLFKQFLTWLDAEVWKPAKIESKEIKKLCQSFYFDKTMARLDTFNKKYPGYQAPTSVNGEPVVNMATLLERLDWDDLTQGVAVFMHGDLQFDNVLYDKKKDHFFLLDWRQDFADEIAYGDLYYDLAKMLGGLLLNYDYIKSNLFFVEQIGDDIVIDFARRYNCSTYETLLEEFVVEKGLDFSKVRLLMAIIYLNMAPLHHPPFDKALYSLANLYLSRIFSSVHKGFS